jgi:mono/diheme cytochrome c family protein
VPGVTFRSLATVVAAVVASAGLLACGDGGSSAVPDDPVLAEGQQVYRSRCASCHGSGGGGGSAPRLKGVIESRYTFERHVQIVVEGAGARMPAFGNELTTEEIEAVVRYEREGL